MTVVDPWKQFMTPLREVELRPDNTALVIVCMQKMWAHPDHGTVVAGRKAGLNDVMDYFTGQFPGVIGNIQRLLGEFRPRGFEVVHAAVGSMTKDGRDKVAYHKDRSGYTRDKVDNEFIDELMPGDDELVFMKTSCSVFNSTNMRQVLNNIGIENLVVTGNVSNSSVGATILDGADLGFNMFLVEDATMSLTPELQQAALEILTFFARIKKTDEILAALK